MTLTLYNTLTRRKEPFRPIDPSNVRMYVCGPTVYDFAHIGNARPVIVFDALFRLLRHIYGAEHVTYARNITDVDDKINARAAEEYPDLPLNEAIRKVTEKTEKQYHEDVAALGVLPPTVEPRATEHIAEMRTLCEALVANKHAYVAQDHVLFDVSSMPDYGRLANRTLEEMEAGARVEVAPYKKGPMDFVLWKPSKPGEPAWPSPAGINAAGRPGWHIECSAMADRWLWQEPQMNGLLSEAGLRQPHVFDIHGGGIDLVFPHHENEIAQSRCAHATPAMAKVWMHNGFLQVEGEKMSKSLGNFVTIRELLSTTNFGEREWRGDVIRWAMLQTHYRQPINWTAERLDEAEDELEGYSDAVSHFQVGGLIDAKRELVEIGLSGEVSDGLVECLEDDLNLPSAIAHLRWLHGKSVRLNQQPEAMHASAQLLVDCDWLGFDLLDRFLELEMRRNELSPQRRLAIAHKFGNRTIDDVITARNAARKAKDFKEADRIRDELSAMGIQLKDSKNPTTGEIETTWEVKR